MACGCCNNESEENYGYVGSGLKWAVNMTCEGFSMDDDDWKIIITRGKNTVEYTKANSIKDEAEDQWYISVDTLALGAGQCYITFVALDENGKPTPIPPVVPETDDEKRRFEEALARKERRG